MIRRGYNFLFASSLLPAILLILTLCLTFIVLLTRVLLKHHEQLVIRAITIDHIIVLQVQILALDVAVSEEGHSESTESQNCEHLDRDNAVMILFALPETVEKAIDDWCW